MAYPPPNHYLSDLGLALMPGDGESRVAIAIEPALCAPGGGVFLGVLATAIDMAAGSLSRRAVEPDWVATSDIAIDLATPLPPGPGWVECRLARRGRGLVSFDVDLSAGDRPGDGAGPCGFATAAFSVLPNPGREQGGERRDGATAVHPADGPAPARPRRRLPLGERLGIRVLDAAAGRVELELDDYVRNTFGALQGGAVAVLAEAAILAATRSPLSGLAVRYRSLGRRGPFRTTIETLPGKLATLVRARVRDDGAEGALVAVATGRLAPR